MCVSFNGQILERSDYVMISGNPFIKKSGNRLWVSLLLLLWHEAVDITSGVCIKQGGGRYHSTSTSLLKSETRLLNLMKIEMFSVLNLWFGHTCSMLSGFWVLSRIVSIYLGTAYVAFYWKKFVESKLKYTCTLKKVRKSGERDFKNLYIKVKS